MPATDIEACAICGGPPPTWIATTRAHERYACCSGCKDRGARQRMGVKYVPIPTVERVAEEHAEDRAEAEQLSLTGPNPSVRPVAKQASARATDPENSHAAARSVNLTEGQGKVLALLDTVGCPLTHEEMVERAPLYGITLSPSGIRTRCRELADRGAVSVCSETTTSAGRKTSRWGRTAWLGTPRESEHL